MKPATRNALKAVKNAQNVPELLTALNELKAVDKEAFDELEVPPIRGYGDWPYVDWSDWSEHVIALAADDVLVLFREGDRLYTITWEDILDVEEA
jgi:hypothetical protein